MRDPPARSFIQYASFVPEAGRPFDKLVRALEAGTLQRNFQGYSTHAECDLLGFGMSAIGAVGV